MLHLHISAAARYPEEFSKLIADGAYKPQQVLNTDEPTLLSRGMSHETCIFKSEMSASSFTAAKDRITLVRCYSVTGDN